MEAYLQPWSAFTASHRPIYSAHEIELAIIDRATLTVGDEKHGRECSVSLSTHRLIFQQPSSSHYIHLALLKRAELHTSFLSSPKLTLHLNPRPIAPPPPPTAPTDMLTYHTHITTTTSLLINPPPPAYFRLSAPSDALQLLAAQLTTALNTRSYAVTPAADSSTSAASATAASKQFSTSSAGVGGLMRDVDASARRTDATLDAAFTDLSTLMKHAADIVTLAQRFARTLASTSHSTEEEAALAALLTTMGLPNPVSKQTATASSFHSQLSRQLSDFLDAHPTYQQQHMMTLPDVYCLYNRARGTDLISPDDCRRACELLSQLSTGNQLQRLEGGVLVVCRTGAVESGVEAVVSAVRGGEAEGGGMAVVELSGVLGVSVVLVEERCVLAEKSGWLVRDESVEGVRWWTNHFDEWTTTTTTPTSAVT